MNILKSIRNSIIISVADTVENHVDGAKVLNEKIRPIIKDLLKSEKDTDKLLKGPVTDFLRELYEGIHGRNTCTNLENWQHQLRSK